MSTLKEKILSGVFWQFFEKLGCQIFLFVISAVLARLLEPDEFGVVAVILVLINFCTVFVDSGFGTALIQKKDADDKDYSSVFYLNIIIATLIYIILFFAAPFIAEFYKRDGLTIYIRVMCLILIINSLSSVPSILLNKKMLFNLSFKVSWISLLVGCCFSISLAWLGYGVWALIISQLAGAVGRSILYCFFIGWHPILAFDIQRIKELYKFGSKLFLSCFLDRTYYDLFSLLLGKIYSLTTLSYYNRGVGVTNTGTGIINGVISSVTLPAFSVIQDDTAQMRRLAKKTVKIMMFFCIPLLSALALFAKPFILLVFGEKWLPAAFFLQLHCLFRILSPLDNMNLQIAIAKKRSDINLKLEILKKLEFIIVILCLCWFGLKILMIGISLCGIIFFIENAWMSKKFINYSPWEQLYDILPIFIITGISAVCGGVFLFIVKTPLLCLLIGGSIYSILYLITSFYCRIFPVEILEHIPFLRFLSRFYKQS